MGDMADYVLEGVMDEEDRLLDYLLGDIDIIEAHELGIVDDEGYIPWSGHAPHNKTCRCCGTSGLHWDETDDGWRLFTNTGIHCCSVNPLK